MPVVILDQLDIGPDELAAVLPCRAELLRVLPGPDRPDYALARLEHPLVTPQRPIFGVVMAARFVGTQFAPDMRDLWVNLAYVIDDSVTQDDALELSKVRYAAVVRINLDPTVEHLPYRPGK